MDRNVHSGTPRDALARPREHEVRGRLTLKDIAAMAGVSRTTASRVLNGRGEVRPEVRARVEAVIADTGYTPLASARSLVSNRSGLVGFVVPLRTAALVQDPYFVALLQGLSHASTRRGLAVALFLFDDESDQDDLLDRVIGPRRIDGLIMSAYHTQEQLLDRLAAYDLPTVTMGPTAWPDVFGSVMVDNVEGGRLAARHLLEIGCTRPGLIEGPLDTQSGAERTQGFREVLADAGVALPERRVRHGDFTGPSGEALVADLDDVDGLFVASDAMAVGAVRGLRARGLRVPQDVAVVGYDDLPLAAEHDPPLTTVRQPIEGIAVAALDMLVDLIEDPTQVSASVLPVELVRRASTAR